MLEMAFERSESVLFESEVGERGRLTQKDIFQSCQKHGEPLSQSLFWCYSKIVLVILQWLGLYNTLYGI